MNNEESVNKNRTVKIEGENIVIKTEVKEELNQKQQLEILNSLRKDKLKIEQEIVKAKESIKQLEGNLDNFESQTKDVLKKLESREKINEAYIEIKVKYIVEELLKTEAMDLISKSRKNEWQDKQTYGYMVQHNLITELSRHDKLREVCPSYLITKFISIYVTKEVVLSLINEFESLHNIVQSIDI